MATTTSARPTPRTPWPSHSQSRQHPKSSTTPLGLPTRTPASVGQSKPPLLSAKVISPSVQLDARSSSPNYFGLIVEASTNPVDSNVGGHVKSNWSPPSSSIKSAGVTSPTYRPVDQSQEYEAFRRQSETNQFNLGHGNLSHFSSGPSSSRVPTMGSLTSELRNQKHTVDLPKFNVDAKRTLNRSLSQHAKDVIQESNEPRSPGKPKVADGPEFFDLPRTESPLSVPPSRKSDLPRSELSHVDERHPRLSLPQNRVDPPVPPSSKLHLQRAETLPVSLNPEGPVMVTPQNLVDLIDSFPSEEILLLDLRVSPQYVQSRIRGAMNLCIPTTLLKRPSFNVQKLAETFGAQKEREKFSHWKETKYIVVYDGSAAQLKDATSCVNTLKKFSNHGWEGASYIVCGGFSAVSKKFPDLIDGRSSDEVEGLDRRSLSIDSNIPGVMPVAGGCPMPATKTAANPFFGSIRQNMDLIGGVGQMSVKRPVALSEKGSLELPKWIQDASNDQNQGKMVADRFLDIERAEQDRMYKALSGNVSYGSPIVSSSHSVQIAGIEKGTKNRYKDMLPYDHSRVRLQNVPSGGCDYVNASHVKAGWSNRHYIASQAPVPATFEDFWRVVWEQDARVIVMLTAESEGGQRKCHPYWLPNDYGPLKLKALSEKRVLLDPTLKSSSSKLMSPDERPGVGRRRATNPFRMALKDATATSPDSEVPHVTVRKLALSHTDHPFQPIREITQLQFSNWPDFGAPAHPAHVLALVEHCGAVVRNYAGPHGPGPGSPAKEGEKPIVVHCSAGCGRTGTFCTVDSVIDILKRQRSARKARREDEMEVDGEEWLMQDDTDLIAKTVEDFRLQRLSMVQTLRQFVLCYESVMEWLVNEMPDKVKKEGLRRSYQG